MWGIILLVVAIAPKILREKFSKACLITSHWDPEQEKLFLGSHWDLSCCWEVHRLFLHISSFSQPMHFRDCNCPLGEIKKLCDLPNLEVWSKPRRKKKSYDQLVLSATGTGWGSSQQPINTPRQGPLVAIVYEPQLCARRFTVSQELQHFWSRY